MYKSTNENIQINDNRNLWTISIEALPLPNTFEPHELLEDIRRIIEDQEAVNEELQSSNKEWSE